MFIWFLLYKLNIIKYSPSFSYIFAIIFISIQILYFIYSLIFTNKPKSNKYSSINFLRILTKLFLAIILDIIPFIILYPFTLDYKTFIINLSVLCIYFIFIIYKKLNIINIYFNNYFDYYITFNEYKNYYKYFFNLT